jgi:exonuclease SbcC
MRPSRLEIEGFTCFREKQVIDFQRLGLFAIAGPTGAGKSSILDAMVFALFGHIPRVGKHGVSEFISLGLDRMSVNFEFEVGPLRYRVVRVGYRAANRPAKVQLERNSDGAWLPIAESVKPVAAEVERILGLNHDTFQQAVLLPQGQFSRFLKARPGEQRIILRNLLQVGIYEELRKTAAARAGAAATEADSLRRRLDEDYAGVSPEMMSNLDARRALLEGSVTADSVAIEARRTAVQELADRARSWGQIHDHHATLAKLESERGGVEAAAHRFEGARRAVPVVPWAEAATRAQKQADQARATLLSKQGAAEKAKNEATTAAGVLAGAARDAAALPELDERILKLEGAVALLPGLAVCRQRVARERTAVKDATSAAASHQTSMDAATAALGRLADEIRASDEQLVQLSYDADSHELLRGLQDLGGRVGMSRRAADDAARELRGAEQRLKEVEEKLGEDASRLASAKDRFEEATRRHDAVQRQRQDLERQHQAHLLREHLVVGGPCPVCEQAVGAIPAVAAPPGLAELREREAGARSAQELARHEHERALGVYNRADADATAAREAVDRIRATRTQRVSELAVLEAELAGSAALPAGPASPEIRLTEALNELGRRAKRHLVLSGTRGTLVEGQRTADAARVLAESQLRAAQAERERAEGRAAAGEKEVLDAELQIRAVAGDADPKEDQERLRKWARDVRAALDRARTEDARCASAVATVEAERLSASNAWDGATVARDTAVERAETAAKVAEFSDLHAAMAAVISPNDQAALDRRVSDWRSAWDKVNHLLAELRPRAGEVEVTVAQVAAERDALAQADRELSNRKVDLGRVTTELEQARKRVDTMGRLEGEWSRQRAEQGWFDQIARDLRTDGFEKWLLDGTFRALVQGASVRLLEMSGRYTLDYREDEFWVVDHDNAREQRKADTLSGGETFLASLCLALELSEQVQRASGAVRLDSLFIDEGFGTLDPETLDTVAGAIETLGEGDRMVGIITHVAELTARLPARIRVSRGPAGSLIHTETA